MRLPSGFVIFSVNTQEMSCKQCLFFLLLLDKFMLSVYCNILCLLGQRMPSQH